MIAPNEALAVDLAKRYWDVANAIVGFSVVQMLAFLYPLAHKEFRQHVVRAFWFVIAGIVASWGLYTWGRRGLPLSGNYVTRRRNYTRSFLTASAHHACKGCNHCERSLCLES